MTIVFSLFLFLSSPRPEFLLPLACIVRFFLSLRRLLVPLIVLFIPYTFARSYCKAQKRNLRGFRDLTCITNRPPNRVEISAASISPSSFIESTTTVPRNSGRSPIEEPEEMRAGDLAGRGIGGRESSARGEPSIRRYRDEG